MQKKEGYHKGAVAKRRGRRTDEPREQKAAKRGTLTMKWTRRTNGKEEKKKPEKAGKGMAKGAKHWGTERRRQRGGSERGRHKKQDGDAAMKVGEAAAKQGSGGLR